MKMKMKMIALTITTAFAAPIAMAETANVNVYGQLGLSADYVTGRSTGASANSATANTNGVPTNTGRQGLVESRYRIASNNSALGFKGTEDLGDGMNAFWQYEIGIAFDRQNYDNLNASTAGGDFISGRSNGQSRRNTFAGIGHKAYGNVALGLQDTPLKLSIAPVNVFPRNYTADMRAVFAVSPVSNVRAENSVQYTSPSLGGVVVKALYGARNESGNGQLAGPSLRSYAVSYTDKALFAVLAYEGTRTVGDESTATTAVLLCRQVLTPFTLTTAATCPAGTTVVSTLTPAVSALAARSAIATVRTVRAGLGYTMGDAKIGAAWERNQNAPLFSPLLGVDASAYYLSGSYKMGINTLKLAYAKRSDNKANNVNNVTNSTGGFITNANDGAIQYSFGVDRALSKRTLVYLLSTTVTNARDGNFAIGGPSAGIAPVGALNNGGSARAISLGMVHNF